MTDKDVPGDDGERETLAGDTSAPREDGTAPEFDLESLPGKRPPPRAPSPTPTPVPAKRKLPAADDFFGAPPATAPASFEPPPSDAPERTVTEQRPSTETPTREIDVERELPTIVGEFAATTTGSATKPPAPSDEAETVVEGGKGETTGPDLVKGTAGTEATGRTAGRPWKSPLSKAASRTVRDPVVGSAAQRGSQPWSPASGSGALHEGQLLADRYELVERLGKGGMGEVWKAKHTLLQGMRAIKVIKASISKDTTFRQRFLKEGQTMMRVKHRGVVEVTDLDETRSNRELFMVMEYLKGRTIYDAVRSKDKPLAADVRDAVRVLAEVADGMQRIHDERIVHKDLKADNVLLVVGEDGLEHPKVIDFGLAKSLGDKDAAPDPNEAQSPQHYDPDLHTTLSGTLAYMAPEQFNSEPSSFQSDIYAFGVMAYEVFSNGEFPLPRGPLTHYMDLHKQGTRPDLVAKKRPDLDPRLTAILDRCLAYDKSARPESFRDVVKDLQYWLDTPERLKKRNQRIAYASAATVLAAAAVWGIFFAGETSASLSNLKVTASGVAFTFDGTTAHVPAAALPALVLTADIKGKPGDPVVEIDGHARASKSAFKDGQLVVTTDVHDVADGNHALALRASSNAAPVDVTLDVDRAPPVVGEISVTGSVVTAAGIFSHSDSPEVVVDVKEPANHIAGVVAVDKDGVRSPGEREKGSDRWVIKGTASKDGPVEVDVVIRDLAGNETKKHVKYVKDVRKPRPIIRDKFTCWQNDNPPAKAHEALFVRSLSGSKMHVTVDEPSDVIAKFGGGPEATVHADAAGEVEIALPDVPRDGIAAEVVVRDVAGNEWSEKFPVEPMPDLVMLFDANSRKELAIGSDSGQPAIVVIGTYPILDGVGLTMRKVRAADGSEVVNAPKAAMQVEEVSVSAEGKNHVFRARTDGLDTGVYSISASVPAGPEIQPMTLIVDTIRPVVESVTVAEDRPGGAVVPDGGWSRSADVVVTAVVSDLSPRRVELNGTKPEEPVEPGRHSYTFKRHLEHEGLNALTLSVADAAGNHVEPPVKIQGDWTTPEIVSLDSPKDGGSYTDVKAVVFKGTCSESAYTLVVEGPAGPLPMPTAICSGTEFEQPFGLNASDGPVAVNVYAVDPAGHRSAPRTISISVVHKTTDLPDEVTWTDEVKVPMEKVMPGDVVIGGRVRAVGLVFVDKCEVTNSAYRAFLAATAGRHGDWCHPEEPKGWDHTPSAATWKDAKWNADDLPVVNVAYWDAFAFAKWSGRRLPSEAEWVKAAAKAKSPRETELRSWPSFGPDDEWKNGVVVTAEWAKGPVSALTGGDVSPVGCLHMGGNVAEWVDLPEPVDGSPAGTRGGSWFFSKRAADVRNTPAKAFDRSFRANTIGLRCAVDASRVQP